MMIKGNKFKLTPIIVMAVCCLLMMIGCGGGAGSSGGHDTLDADSGKVALYLADAPTDDFDHIWVEISEIALIPCGDEETEIIFQSDDPERIDLLALQDGDDMLLTVQEGVTAGTYCKIRLEVEEIVGEQGEDLVDINLSSAKIDLNPQGRFDVHANETLSIHLDIDAEKSIHLSGPHYNFRPVVFVDFDDATQPRHCRHILQGEITELLYAEEAAQSDHMLVEDDAEEDPQDTDVIGFKLSLRHGHNAIAVMLQEDTIIFDATGQSTGPDALAVDQFVGVKGWLDRDANLQADLVVIGSTLKVSGTVETAVDENGTFTLDPSGFAPIFSEAAITVSLSDNTAISLGNDEVDSTQIQPGQKMRVVGKYDADSETLNAIAIFIKAQKKTGPLTALEPVEGGSLLTILAGGRREAYEVACYREQEEEETEIKVFLPQSVSPEIKGDGTLTLDELSQLISCVHPLVQVVLSNEPAEDAPAEVLALQVVPQRLDVVTVSTIAEGVITTTSDETILVTDETKIWGHDHNNQEPIVLEAIESGDALFVAALSTCEPTDYLAVTIIKIEPVDPPDGDECIPKIVKLRATIEAIEERVIVTSEGDAIHVPEATPIINPGTHDLEYLDLEALAEGDQIKVIALKSCDDEEESLTAHLIVLIT